MKPMWFGDRCLSPEVGSLVWLRRRGGWVAGVITQVGRVFVRVGFDGLGDRIGFASVRLTALRPRDPGKRGMDKPGQEVA